MEPKNQWHKPDRETAVFILFLMGMAVYYGWRMFALTPWYDELYTYYYFISRGPLYAAVHWPLPNNHICYSVLSACLGVFGNPAVALRGVSYLSSMGSLILLFRMGRKCLDRGLAFMPVFLYTGMKLTNQLAVQGRGYALVTFCYLTALWELTHIAAEGRDRVCDYIIFGASLVIALYAIPSSVYVVAPVCLTGGVALLLDRQYRRLFRLILTSLASAVCTVGLYGIVWLAVGSNLLQKTEGSAYYGMGHGAIALHAPFAALKTGIDYMLATPYIQSVDRDGFMGRFAGWLYGLLNEYYAGGAVLLAVLLAACAVLALASIVRNVRNVREIKNDRSYIIDVIERRQPRSVAYDRFMAVYLAVSIFSIPLMLIVQCTLPYYRVFSFAGVVAAFSAAWLWQMPGRRWTAGRAPAAFAGNLLAALLCAVLLASPSYRAQYGGREAAIEDAYRHADMLGAGRIAVTDCDQEYLLLFLYGIGEEGVTRAPEEAGVVLADKFLLLDYNTDVIDWSGDDWKLYLTREQFEASGVAERMEAVYENDRFVLYVGKEESW